MTEHNEIAKQRTKLRAAFVGIPQAFKRTKAYVAVGVLVGSAVLGISRLVEFFLVHLEPLKLPLIQSSVPWVRFGETILEHLGAGFFVSAIAVFAYEWRAHEKEALELSERLANIIEQTVAPMLTAVARDSLIQSIETLAGRPSGISAPLLSLTDALSLMRPGIWSKDAYLAFIAHMLSTVSQNANELASLSAAVEENSSSAKPFQLNLGTPGALASTILSRHVEQLPAGGSYDALSDVSSWQYLRDFTKAQRGSVVNKGVHIRRVFLLRNKAVPDAARVIISHLKKSHEWTAASAENGKHGSYLLRVIAAGQFTELSEREYGERHFGIFSRRIEGEAAIVFEVEEEDLSRFTLRAAAGGGTLAVMFERVWLSVEHQRPAELADLLLENQIKTLEDHGRYDVVSDFASWFEGGLTRFHHQCIDDARERGIRIRRLFVARSTDDPDACRAILRTHREEMLEFKKTRGGYDVKICRQDELGPLTAAKWQFGVFIPPGASSAELVITETTGADMTDFVVRSSASDHRAEQFEALWTTTPILKKRLRNLSADWVY